MQEDSYAFQDWSGIKSIHQLTGKRYDKHSGKETREVSYYISSVQDSKRVFRAIRDHWKIENQLHYMLDVYLGEDASSKRAGEAAKNMELLLFILQRLKAKLGKSIPRVQMLQAKPTPMQLFDLGL
jgi:ISPg2, transposase